jgi:hypothetical protein
VGEYAPSSPVGELVSEEAVSIGIEDISTARSWARWFRRTPDGATEKDYSTAWTVESAATSAALFGIDLGWNFSYVAATVELTERTNLSTSKMYLR